MRKRGICTSMLGGHTQTYLPIQLGFGRQTTAFFVELTTIKLFFLVLLYLLFSVQEYQFIVSYCNLLLGIAAILMSNDAEISDHETGQFYFFTAKDQVQQCIIKNKPNNQALSSRHFEPSPHALWTKKTRVEILNFSKKMHQKIVDFLPLSIIY